MTQTGVAVRGRYRHATIEDCGAIGDVPGLLRCAPGPYVVPLWNSHAGEIVAAQYVWDGIEEATIEIRDIWAKMIEFWFMRRAGPRTSYGKIGSVGVAAVQCSAFFKKRSAEIVAHGLTKAAFEAYCNGAEWDGVLVPAPHTKPTGYKVEATKTANPNNFTSFVQLVPARSGERVGEVCITGVTMPALGGAVLGESERSFFDRLLDPIENLNEAPKLVFVLRRTERVGLLFEGGRLEASDLLDAGQSEAGEISVHEDAGRMKGFYSDQLRGLIQRKCASLSKGDFVVHQGENSCLFACPPLRLYTHGYEIEAVEPVIRYYVSQLFGLWDHGIACTADQRRFFRRHQAAWRDNRLGFMQFRKIGSGT